MCGTRFQVPQRVTIAFVLYIPFSSYSIDVGSFCICRARFAQSPKSESIPIRCFLFASIPHAISAFVKVVKWLRTALRPTGVIVFNSVSVGTRPSFCANPWIAAIISSLLIAFSPVETRVAQPPSAVGFFDFLPHRPISLKLTDRSHPAQNAVFPALAKGQLLSANGCFLGFSSIRAKYQVPTLPIASGKGISPHWLKANG